MIKNKLINIMLLFAVLSGNVWGDSKAIYDSNTKTLSLKGVLVPFIDEFTGKETDNKGIFDAQLQEKTKLVFELIPWSINFKNTFDGENTSGYILYDYKTRSVKIPCFEVTTIAKFGDGIEGEAIYYKDVNMKQRHVNYPIFHVQDMTKTDSCESSIIPEPQKPPQKPSLTTTPTTTEDDTVEVEVNGENGTSVFVNGVDTGKTIDSNGKVKVTLDTSGDARDKSFSISLKDDKGNESEALIFVITKESIFIQKPTLTTIPTTTQDDAVEVEVNGEDGTTVFVNGVDSGKTIDSTGKVKITLDTSGDAGDKSFSISLKDSAGNESEALIVVITINGEHLNKTKLLSMIVASGGNDDWSKSFSEVNVSSLHNWAKMTKTIPFNKKMFIDLGSTEVNLKNKHKNPSFMWILSYPTDEGYINLDFKDKDGETLHSFKFINPRGNYNDAYIEFDGNQHNDSNATYQVSIFGYIYIENGKFIYDGENRIISGKNYDGLSSKTWEILNFYKVKEVTISIGALATYNTARIPLYIEFDTP